MHLTLNDLVLGVRVEEQAVASAGHRKLSGTRVRLGPEHIYLDEQMSGSQKNYSGSIMEFKFLYVFSNQPLSLLLLP